MKEHRKSLSNDMPRWLKYPYFATQLFGNAVINKIPSRHIRKWYYQSMGAEIGKDSGLCRRVEVSYPKGLVIDDNVDVGWFALLDCRGG